LRIFLPIQPIFFYYEKTGGAIKKAIKICVFYEREQPCYTTSGPGIGTATNPLRVLSADHADEDGCLIPISDWFLYIRSRCPGWFAREGLRHVPQASRLLFRNGCIFSERVCESGKVFTTHSRWLLEGFRDLEDLSVKICTTICSFCVGFPRQGFCG